MKIIAPNCSSKRRRVFHILLFPVVLMCSIGSIADANGQQVATGSLSGRLVLSAPIPKVPPLKVLPNGLPNFGHFPTDEQRAQMATLMVDVEDQSLRVSEEGVLS